MCFRLAKATEVIRAPRRRRVRVADLLDVAHARNERGAPQRRAARVAVAATLRLARQHGVESGRQQVGVAELLRRGFRFPHGGVRHVIATGLALDDQEASV